MAAVEQQSSEHGNDTLSPLHIMSRPPNFVATSSPTLLTPTISPALALPHRLSTHSRSHSRHSSAVFPLFHSSLPYTLVRDFAYMPYDAMHYGPLDDLDSAISASPGGCDANRRISDPPPWDASAGPWRDNNIDHGAQPLPSTSFGTMTESDDENTRRASRRVSKHRKSKSYTYTDDHGRGRQRLSRSMRNSDMINAHLRQLSSSRPRSLSGAHPQVRRQSLGETETAQEYTQYPNKGAPASVTTRDVRNAHTDNRGPGYDISAADAVHHPPFREDTDLGPYSPSGEDHRPESASLDESYAGPSLALYDFRAENDNELELREGQIIQVGYRHGQGWLVAMNLETGEQGLVPEEYVRLLRDIEGWCEHVEDFAKVEEQSRSSRVLGPDHHRPWIS